MTTTLTRLIADRAQPDTAAAPTDHTLDTGSGPDPFWAPVVVRLATAGDRRSLERLAQLDSARPPVGETLIGELHGDPVAAVSLTDGGAIADPFVAAAPILELVRLRAEQLGPQSRNWHLERAPKGR